MRKWMVLVVALFTLTGIVSIGSSYASAPNTPVHVFIDGLHQKDIIMVDNYVLIPLRAYAPNRLEFTFRYTDQTIEVLDPVSDKHFAIKNGERKALVDGEEVELKTPVMVNETGHTYVPLSFFAEYMDADVQYKPSEKRVIVRTLRGKDRYHKLMTGSLFLSRTLALELPQTYYGFPGGYNRPSIKPSGTGSKLHVYFPRGEALRYVMEYKGLLTYVEINEDGLAFVKWVKDTLKDDVELGEQPAPFEASIYDSKFRDEVRIPGK
ncbi:hypothetical protein PA598K_00357 [Paenibacillus sp. 598K]|uniref:copper amine oxidase N-terminal domain-containing protein n=1 Tax=Paenibacillus sp. 598K TaxID=1117987 RepID=UPI000FFAB16B|nr:copper amine oxidase N-terminal domain-containing protein [Paenibacillus sp. 598K]GBF72121.1 hypothetical protein PA598K_00357 [Paenibacillus sp. 598K]